MFILYKRNKMFENCLVGLPLSVREQTGYGHVQRKGILEKQTFNIFEKDSVNKERETQ